MQGRTTVECTYLTTEELKAVAAHWKVDLGGLPTRN